MRLLAVALLTVAVVTGCGPGKTHQPAQPPFSSGGGDPNLPDISFKFGQIFQSPAGASQTNISFTPTVTNGTVAQITWRILMNGSATGLSGSVAPDTTVTKLVQIPLSSTGVFGGVVTVELDFNNAVDESDEGNNSIDLLVGSTTGNG